MALTLYAYVAHFMSTPPRLTVTGRGDATAYTGQYSVNADSQVRSELVR